MSSFFSLCGHRARRAVSFNVQSGCGAIGMALERPQTRPAEQPNVLNDRVVFAGA